MSLNLSGLLRADLESAAAVEVQSRAAATRRGMTVESVAQSLRCTSADEKAITPVRSSWGRRVAERGAIRQRKLLGLSPSLDQTTAAPRMMFWPSSRRWRRCARRRGNGRFTTTPCPTTHVWCVWRAGGHYLRNLPTCSARQSRCRGRLPLLQTQFLPPKSRCVGRTRPFQLASMAASPVALPSI
jgi:hypothetical protein